MIKAGWAGQPREEQGTSTADQKSELTYCGARVICAARPATAKLLAAVQAFQPGEKLAAEDTFQRLFGEKKRIGRAYPTCVLWRQTTLGNHHTVNVGMQQQVLAPGTQNAEHADLGAQVPGIARHLEGRRRAGGEQQIVEQARVLQRQHVEFVRHGEDYVKVAGGQQFLFSRGLRASCLPRPYRDRSKFRTLVCNNSSL